MRDAGALGTGTFVWYDLKTRDFESAWAFYGKLFGWKRNETDFPVGRYSMIRLGDRNLGGIVPISHEDQLPTHWIGYVAVADVDAAARAAIELEGSVPLPPTDIPQIGRFAVVLDPHGAAICPFQWTGPADPPIPDASGSFCWSELLTPDPYRAGEFYRRVCGWTMERGRPGAYDAYWLFRAGGRAVAGMVQRPTGADYPPQWLHYVRVPRTEDASARAADLGGSVLLPATEIPGTGRFAILDDPAGGIFAVFEGE